MRGLDKRLLALTGSVRAFLGVTVGLGLLTAILIVFQAFFLSEIIDLVFLKNNAVLPLGAMLAILLVVISGRALLAWAMEVSSNRAAGQVKTRLREDMFAHLLKLGPAYTRRERSGELANTAVEGVETLDAYFSLYIPQVFLTMLVPLLVWVVVFVADPLSGIVLALTAPVLPVFMILIGKMAEAVNKKQWQQLGQMSAHFLDVLQGLTTLKLFGRSRLQEEKIATISDRFRVTTMKVLRVAFLSALVMEVGASISTAIIAVEIGFRLLYNQIPFQSAFFVLLLAPEFYLPMRSLGQRFHASMSASESSNRIFEILGISPQNVDTKNVNQSSTTNRQSAILSAAVVNNASLRFSEVYFAYPTEDGERAALRGVSFEMRAGEKLALVGASGAGKSTVAQLLLRFVEPNSGQISLETGAESMDLAQIPAKEWRNYVGWVAQNPYLFNTTIADNIRLGRPEAQLEEVIAAAKQAHLHEFIASLPQGYETVIGERGARLSGGQAQRLSLARAFLKNAPILVLDEATSNLDTENETLVLDAIEKLMAGRTVLMIAHRASTIARADRIIELEAGRVVREKIESQKSKVESRNTRVRSQN